MAKETNGGQGAPREGVVSIIGPGMRVVGDCDTEGTIRIEGTVEGTVRAGKAVVVGKDGEIKGDVHTQDAIIGGKITGTIVAESRLELQATCMVEGEIRARRIKLDEGGRINGKVVIGEVASSQPPATAKPLSASSPSTPSGSPSPRTAEVPHGVPKAIAR